MRGTILVGLLLLGVTGVGAQNPGQPAGKNEQPTGKDGQPSLKEKLQAADIVVVGKVIQTGLSVASSFDIGIIEVKEVLKGEAKIKTAHFKFTSSGGIGLIAPYGKKGVEGVWVLSKKANDSETPSVLAYLPLNEAKAVRDLLANPNMEAQPPQAGGKVFKIHAQAAWNRESPKPQLVIRNPAELAAAFPPLVAVESLNQYQKVAVQDVAKVLKVKDIDWQKQMVVVISYGKVAHQNIKVKFSALEQKGNKLLVHAQHISPGEPLPSKDNVYLTQIALVDRFDGPVQFEVFSINLP